MTKSRLKYLPLSLFLVLLTLMITISSRHSVYAIKTASSSARINNCEPWIPLNICDLSNSTGTERNFAGWNWVSVPTWTRVVSGQIDYRAGSIALQYNLTGVATPENVNSRGVVIVQDKVRTLTKITAQSASITGNGYNITGLPVNLPTLISHDYNYNYKFLPNSFGFASAPFSVSNIPVLPPGTYNLTVDITDKQMHETIFTATKYQCVEVAGTVTAGPFKSTQGTIENLINYCQNRTHQAVFTMTILPPPNQPAVPTLTVDCSNITAKALDADIAGGATSWRLIEGGRIIRSGSGGPSTFKTKDLFPQDGLTRNLYLSYDDKNSSGAIVSTSQIGPRPLSCKGFDFTPKAQVQLFNNDQIDAESPNKAKFSNMGILRGSFSGTVKGVTVTRTYTVTRGSITAPNPASITSDISIASGYDFGNEERPVSGLFPGDKVCVVVTVDKGSGVIDGSGNVVINEGPKSNPPACDTVINKPYVSFYGGDVNTCGGIKTFYKPSTKVGSGVQYVAQANSSVDQFTSAFGIGTTPKVLTFANTGSEYGGDFAGVCITRNYFTNPPATPEAAINTIDPGTLASGSKLYNAPTGGIELRGGSIPTGARTALYINGDLRITGNITYANTTWANIAEIPSLHVYVKGNIYIQPGVTNLTGFFVAQQDGANTGSIYTCANGTSRMPIANILGSCATQLKVRGAFSSNKTYFDRSIGSLRNGSPNETYTANSAAETFFIGPEMYFVSPGSINTSGTTTTGGYQYQTVLPPLL